MDSLPIYKPSIICVIGWFWSVVVESTYELCTGGAVWGGDDSSEWLIGDDGHERGLRDSHRFGYKSKNWLNGLLRINIGGKFIVRQRWISSHAHLNGADNWSSIDNEGFVQWRRIFVWSSYKIMNWLSCNCLISIVECCFPLVFKRLREILSETRRRIELRIRCSLWRNGEPQSKIVNVIFSFNLSANSVGLINRSDDRRVFIGMEGTVGQVGVKASVWGRRRLAGGEESSGNDVNFDDDSELSSVEEKILGDVDGWLRDVRKSEVERLIVVFVKNKDVGRVGVVTAGKLMMKLCLKKIRFFSYFHSVYLLEQLVIDSWFLLLFFSFHFDLIVFFSMVLDWWLMLNYLYGN